MSTEETDLLVTLKKQVIAGFISLVGVGAIACMTFYYGTNNQLAEHEKALNSIEARIDRKASQDELLEFKTIVREDVRSLRLDIKEVRDDNKKILEILSDRRR